MNFLNKRNEVPESENRQSDAKNNLIVRYIMLLVFSIFINVAIVYFYLFHQPAKKDYQAGIKMMTRDYFGYVQQTKK